MAITGGQVGFTGYQRPDYSASVAASALPLATLSKSISDLSNYKKEQKKIEADNKASAKSIEAAIILGKSYKVSGVEETLSPFLNAYNDASLSPIEKAALLDEGKGMIANVFGRFDASQADAIQMAQLNARNAPPMPEPFKLEDKLLSVAGGNILVKQGSDGQTYDSSGQYPVYDLAAFISGATPEVYSDPNRANIDPVTGIDPQAISNAAGSQYFQGKGPLLEDQINSALYVDEGVLPAIGQIPDPSTRRLQNLNLGGFVTPSVPQARTSRLITEPSKAEAEETVMTLAEVEELVNKGVKINAVPLGGGKFRVTESTFGNKPLVEVNTAKSLQEERAKEVDKRLFDQREQLQGATANKDSIKEMVKLIDQGVKTGFAQDAIMQFNRAFGKDVSDSETFKAVAGDVAMGFINLTKGAISDKEMTYFTTVLAPNLGNTPEGNKKIGEFMLKAVGKAERIEKVISEGMRQNKNAFDIDEEVRRIRNADDLLAGASTSSTGKVELLPDEQQLIDKHKTK